MSSTSAPSTTATPAKAKTPKAPTEPRAKKPRMEVQFNEEEGSRSMRQSTKVKTVNADMARERRDAEQKHKARPQVQRVKAMFDQDEMLREALQTEVSNEALILFYEYSVFLIYKSHTHHTHYYYTH
ncbi:hypothetical protein EON65_16060 [archaeon]|nr:MAG: hypothetical protein EON65_16060 [archaeon]